MDCCTQLRLAHADSKLSGPVVGQDSTFIGLKKFLRTGLQKGANLSVSGGSDVIRYFLSGDYEFAEGTLPKNDSRRVGLRGNFGFEPQKGLAIDVNTAFSNRRSSFLESGDNTYGFLTNVFRGTQDYTGGKPEILLADRQHWIDRSFRRCASRSITRLVVDLDEVHDGRDYTNAFTRDIPVRLCAASKVSATRALDPSHADADLASTWRANIGKAVSSLSVGGHSSRTSTTHSWHGRGFWRSGQVTLSSGATSRAKRIIATIVNAEFLFRSSSGSRQYSLTVGARADGNSSFGSDLGLQVYPKLSGSDVISDEGFWPNGGR